MVLKRKLKEEIVEREQRKLNKKNQGIQCTLISDFMINKAKQQQESLKHSLNNQKIDWDSCESEEDNNSNNNNNNKELQTKDEYDIIDDIKNLKKETKIALI